MTTTTPPAPAPLTSVYTSNLPGILTHYGISLAVSTYQAGKVILVRADAAASAAGGGAGSINTHFRNFNKPMGIAGDGNRLTVGGVNTVWTYRNMTAVARKLDPPGKHDACYLPRRIHVTGDIDIHELGYAADGELWIVNTRFGCLCTLDAEHSFTPRWRPHFVSELAPEDRCHLNGLAMADGRPRFVTALGETDVIGGWRANKRSGGLLMDVPSNQILLRGLSMPHSPRLYAGRLWLLESGQGGLAWADLPNRTWHTVATLPGFTRGISFVDRLAFIGLSQVRESATFSGIPLVERLTERTCGVWVVNIQTGETVAFLRFESGVQEIFAVQALPTRYPELLDFGDERINHSYVIPDAALAETPAALRETDQGRKTLDEQPQAVDQERPSAVVLGQSSGEDSFIATFNRGVAALEQDRFAEAQADLAAAAEMQPGRAEVWNNLANVFFRQARMGDAIPCYERAVGLNPNQADAHMNLGMALLTLGDLRRGFTEFEWRWQTNQFTPFLCPQPRWDGSPAGPDPSGLRKPRGSAARPPTILIHTEQGAGDSIMCARFIPQVAALGWRVLLAAPEPLQDLMRTVAGVGEVIGPGDIPVNAFDVYAPLMSLPAILGTTLETIPQTIPYLQAPDDRRPTMGHEPSTTDDRPSAIGHRPLRVGLAWAGSPTQGNDRNRSARLADFAPVLAVPGVEFYSLQVGAGVAELAAWTGQPPIQDLAPPVRDLAPQLRTWADTAAAISQMDLVISVDTGVVHLAGALGKPVWVLLCQAPDWRWLLDRDDSPWYPTARLFRQQQAKDWAPVMAAVAAALARLTATE
jgi:uncharacterized protein (TIGR03032 family)